LNRETRRASSQRLCASIVAANIFWLPYGHVRC
jgi:hypothetical protein